MSGSFLPWVKSLNRYLLTPAALGALVVMGLNSCQGKTDRSNIGPEETVPAESKEPLIAPNQETSADNSLFAPRVWSLEATIPENNSSGYSRISAVSKNRIGFSDFSGSGIQIWERSDELNIAGQTVKKWIKRYFLSKATSNWERTLSLAADEVAAVIRDDTMSLQIFKPDGLGGLATVGRIEPAQQYSALQSAYIMGFARSSEYIAISFRRIESVNDALIARKSIHIYKLANNVWTFEQAIEQQDREEFLDIAMTGNTLAVAMSEKIILYEKTDDSWKQQSVIESPAKHLANTRFGFRVQLSEKTLVVSAPHDNYGPKLPNSTEALNSEVDKPQSGAVYIFKKDTSQWILAARLKPLNYGDNINFGTTMWFDGTTLVIGAQFESSRHSGIFQQNFPTNDSEKKNSGAIYIFREHESVWHQEAFIKAPVNMAGSFFGKEVVVLDDIIATLDTLNAAYIYTTAAQTPACQPTNSPDVDSDGDGDPDSTDCVPCNRFVHRNAGFSGNARSDGSFDWNCDGKVEKNLPELGSCTFDLPSLSCIKKDGWLDFIPECGKSGAVVDYCIKNFYNCGTQYTGFQAVKQLCK